MAEEQDRPKKSALLTLDDMREIIAYYDANWAELTHHIKPGMAQVRELTLEQLIEIAFASRDHVSLEAWLAATGQPACDELVRILRKEPHRRGLKLKIVQDDTAEDPEKSFDDPSPETIEAYRKGNVWGFVLMNEEGDVLDSCWGFYGDDKDGIAFHLMDDAAALALLDDAWTSRGAL